MYEYNTCEITSSTPGLVAVAVTPATTPATVSHYTYLGNISANGHLHIKLDKSLLVFGKLAVKGSIFMEEGCTSYATEGVYFGIPPFFTNINPAVVQPYWRQNDETLRLDPVSPVTAP
jgi:hypothetical protein